MSTSPTKLTALPLFPLNTVLFPGGSLALRIFEVRYLDMIGTRHKAGQPFGVVCLSEGSEVRSRASGMVGGEPAGDGFAHEAFFSIGTLARITKLERPQPGLMMIACVRCRADALASGSAHSTLGDEDPERPVSAFLRSCPARRSNFETSFSIGR